MIYRSAGLYIVIFMCFFLLAGAQVKFQRTYGGTLVNEGRSVVQTLDGGYIMAGSSSSFGNGSSDVLLVKTDDHGIAQFMKTYGGSDIDRGYAVLQLSDSGYAISGYTSSFGSGGYDAYLIRTDKNGDTLWTKTYGGADWDFVYSCVPTGDSGFVMAGNSYSFGNGSSDGWMICVDAAGVVRWQKNFLTDDDDFLNLIDTGYKNSFIASGYTIASNGGRDMLVANISATGDSLWYRTFNKGKDEEANVGRLISDSTYIVGGRTYDTAQSNTFLMKLDTLGNEVWYNQLVTNAGTNNLYDLLELPSKHFVVLGSTTGGGLGGHEVHLVYADRNGGFMNAPTYGGAGNDFAFSIKRTTDNGFIMAGETTTWGPGLKAALLIKTDSIGSDTTTIIGIQPLQDNSLGNFIYPNPCSGKCYIKVPGNHSGNMVCISVYDVTGKKMVTAHSDFKDILELDTHTFSSGLYVVEISSGNLLIGNGKLLVE